MLASLGGPTTSSSSSSSCSSLLAWRQEGMLTRRRVFSPAGSFGHQPRQRHNRVTENAQHKNEKEMNATLNKKRWKYPPTSKKTQDRNRWFYWTCLMLKHILYPPWPPTLWFINQWREKEGMWITVKEISGFFSIRWHPMNISVNTCRFSKVRNKNYIEMILTIF